MANGIVVDHKESNIRYAIQEDSFDKKIHSRVRELRPGETVYGFQPILRDGAVQDPEITPEAASTPDASVTK